MSWIEQLAPKHVQQLTPYQSARRIGGSGNVWINANEAPSAPLFLGEESRANRYPEPQPAKVVQQYAEYCRVGSGQITVCRGADEGIAEMKGRVTELNQRRDQFLAELERIPGVQPFPGAGNYILAHIRESKAFFQKLWDEGVIVRNQTAQPGLNNCLRFSIGSEQDMQSTLALLRQSC